MDDAQTYLLNGLLSRQFDLGRISRFRKVGRGRQAETFELLTSEHNEYVVSIYPAGVSAERLNFAAAAVNMLDANRFSVVPYVALRGTGECFVAEGPQGGLMMVGLAPAGSALEPGQYTEHDVSQVGLRLGWMHRLFAEQLKLEAEHASGPRDWGQKHGTLAERLKEALARPESRRNVPGLPGAVVEQLVSQMNIPTVEGWAHGDLTPAALLHDADHQLRAVVDFALMHWGSPLEDLVDAFLTLVTDRGGAGEHGVPAKSFFEAYDSLRPIKQAAWTPVVARWCAQRLIDAAEGLRGLPRNFGKIVVAPENLATAMASFF